MSYTGRKGGGSEGEEGGVRGGGQTVANRVKSVPPDSCFRFRVRARVRARYGVDHLKTLLSLYSSAR